MPENTDPRGYVKAAAEYCKGMSAMQALAYAGYAEKTRRHHSRGALRSRHMQRGFKEFGLALLTKLGRKNHPEAYELLNSGDADPDKVIETARNLAMLYHPRKQPKMPESAQKAIEQSGSESDPLASLDERTRADALLAIGYATKPGELGSMGRARLKQIMLNPYKNARDMNQAIRLSLETDGMIGGPSELHLHNHQTLPPVVQKMLEEKMLQILRERGEGPEQIRATLESEGIVIDANESREESADAGTAIRMEADAN